MRHSSHPKIQHYVPQFILRGFTEGKNQLNVFDKHTSNRFKSNIKKVAAESKFYDFKLEGAEISLEEDLSRVETKITPVINDIINQKSISQLTIRQRKSLSDFLSLQFIRTPQYRAGWQQMGSLIRNWLQEHVDTEEQLVLEHMGSPGEAKIAHLQQISEYTVFSKCFFEKPWILFRTTSKKPFWISDNPIAMQNIREATRTGNLGLAVDGIEIYFPLSKSLCLSMMCPSNLEMVKKLMTFKKENPEPAKQISNDWNRIGALEHGFRTGEAILTPQDTVTNINSLQVINSSRFIFSNLDHFSLAEEMLSDTPAYRQGPRMVSDRQIN